MQGKCWFLHGAKVAKLDETSISYHNSTRNILISGNEINDAFSWIRSWINSLPAIPAIKIKATKNGTVTNRKGETLLINFFILMG